MSNAMYVPVTMAIYAEGRLLTARYVHSLDVSPRAFSTLRLHSATQSHITYQVGLESLGQTEPGWVTFRVQLCDEYGALLGPPGVPALLWLHPWPVPMVSHLPQIRPEIPMHTLVMQVMEPAAAIAAALLPVPEDQP